MVDSVQEVTNYMDILSSQTFRFLWTVSSTTIRAVASAITDSPQDPCDPSPCGSNAVCR
jgi:hypothetical protein